MQWTWTLVGTPRHGAIDDIPYTAKELAEAIIKKGGLEWAVGDVVLFAGKRAAGDWLAWADATERRVPMDEFLTLENVLWPSDQSPRSVMRSAPRDDVVHVLVLVPQAQEKKKQLHELLHSETTPSLFAGRQYSDSWTQVLRKHRGQIDCHRSFRRDEDKDVEDEEEEEGDAEPPTAPLVLLHEVFAQFHDNIQHLPINSVDCAFVTEICEATASQRNTRFKYADNVTSRLGSYLDASVSLVDIDSDGVFAIRFKCSKPLLLSLIVRPERGGGRSTGDATMENMAYYLKHFEEAPTSQYPCLLLDMCGPMLTIFGIVNISDRRAVCEPLAPMIPLLFFENEWLLTSAARVFAALKVAVHDLKQWTGSPLQQATAFHPGYALFRGIPPRPWFPYKDTVTIANVDSPVTLEYKRVVASNVFEAWLPLLQSDVVVKFVSCRYGADVHNFCHLHQFAPRLYSEEAIPGGWICVVMEKVVDLQPLDAVEDQETVRDQLQELEKLLTHSGLVHGDLRRETVRWDAAKQHVVVLSFDWAGQDGVVTYPLLMDTHIHRPEGAENGQSIRAAHDIESLRRLCVDVENGLPQSSS